MLTSPDDQVGLLFSFDGASRGNPGDAAQGTCAWWGTWTHNSFSSKGSLICKGMRLGCQTNNYAEVKSLVCAVKAALHFHFWFLGICSQAGAGHQSSHDK